MSSVVPYISDWEIGLRIAAAAILCGLIGFEREVRDHAAGMRTHILVGAGATIFTIVSAYGFSEFLVSTPNGMVTRADPTRIAAQIVTGIGFLGGGVIVYSKMTVRGLTTAATLWIAAAIGIACGAGMWFLAFWGTVGTLLTLVALRYISRPIVRRIRVDYAMLHLEVTKEKRLNEALTLIASYGADVRSMTTEQADDMLIVRIELMMSPDCDSAGLVRDLSQSKGIKEVSISGHNVEEAEAVAKTVAEMKANDESSEAKKEEKKEDEAKKS